MASSSFSDPIDLINLKREHVQRLANQNGASGEAAALANNMHFVARPTGTRLEILMTALQQSGINIKKSSFDAIARPVDCIIDFSDPESVAANLTNIIFVEIKTSNQARVRPDFSGFFFALTENEILASEALGHRHRVMLLNKVTGAVLLTSVPEILSRARSINWQVSVQI